MSFNWKNFKDINIVGNQIEYYEKKNHYIITDISDNDILKYQYELAINNIGYKHNNVYKCYNEIEDFINNKDILSIALDKNIKIIIDNKDILSFNGVYGTSNETCIDTVKNIITTIIDQEVEFKIYIIFYSKYINITKKLFNKENIDLISRYFKDDDMDYTSCLITNNIYFNQNNKYSYIYDTKSHLNQLLSATTLENYYNKHLKHLIDNYDSITVFNIDDNKYYLLNLIYIFDVLTNISNIKIYVDFKTSVDLLLSHTDLLKQIYIEKNPTLYYKHSLTELLVNGSHKMNVIKFVTTYLISKIILDYRNNYIMNYYSGLTDKETKLILSILSNTKYDKKYYFKEIKELSKLPNNLIECIDTNGNIYKTLDEKYIEYLNIKPTKLLTSKFSYDNNILTHNIPYIAIRQYKKVLISKLFDINKYVFKYDSIVELNMEEYINDQISYMYKKNKHMLNNITLEHYTSSIKNEIDMYLENK